MRLYTLLLGFVIVFIFIFFIFPRVVTTTEASCSEWGFTEALMCSKCEQLKEFVTEEELYQECLKCCAKDDIDSANQYPYATLQVDLVRVFFFPRIEKFVNEMANKFPGLKVKNRSGVYPTLMLEDEDKKVVETVSVESWESHTIVDYLKEKLTNGEGKPRGGFSLFGSSSS